MQAYYRTCNSRNSNFIGLRGCLFAIACLLICFSVSCGAGREKGVEIRVTGVEIIERTNVLSQERRGESNYSMVPHTVTADDGMCFVHLVLTITNSASDSLYFDTQDAELFAQSAKCSFAGIALDTGSDEAEAPWSVYPLSHFKALLKPHETREVKMVYYCPAHHPAYELRIRDHGAYAIQNPDAAAPGDK